MFRPLERKGKEADLLNSLITYDETWVLTYDPETKRQSMHWNSTSTPRPPPPKKGRNSFEVQKHVDFFISSVFFWQGGYPAAGR